VPNKSEAILMT